MDASFRCEQCDVHTTTLRSLVRHYRNIHGSVPDSCREIKEKSVECPDCGKQVKNLTCHKDFCSVKKLGRPSAGASSSPAASSPTVGLARLQLSDGGDHENSDLSGFISEETFFNLFRDFVIEREGNKATTFKQYAQKLQQFQRFLVKNDPDFKFGRTLEFLKISSINDYHIIPIAYDWIKTYPSNESKAMAIAAYIKLIDFFKFTLTRLQHKLNDDLRIKLKDRFDLLRDDAQNIQKKVSANIIPDRKERNAQAEHFVEEDEELEIPMETMKEHVDFYRNCNYRLQMYEKLNDMEEAMNFGGETPVKIRNFLALEVLFESGGQRPEVIRNMSIGNLYNASIDNERGQMRVINMPNHKTSKSYGPAQVFVPEKLYILLINYCKKVRGLLADMVVDKEQQYKHLLFVAQGTGEPLQNLDASCKIFANVTQSKHKIFPKCFRYLVALLGQTSEDPKIREKLPIHMNHSQSTAQLHYVRQDEKRKEHSRMLYKVLGRSENLPDVDPLDNDFEETRAEMNAAKKAKMDEEATKKDEDFVAGPRKVFSPSEKATIVETFKDVQQGSLRRTDYDSALERDEKFKELVQNHLGQGKSDLKLFTQVKNSFRATRRK